MTDPDMIKMRLAAISERLDAALAEIAVEESAPPEDHLAAMLAYPRRSIDGLGEAVRALIVIVGDLAGAPDRSNGSDKLRGT